MGFSIILVYVHFSVWPNVRKRLWWIYGYNTTGNFKSPIQYYTPYNDTLRWYYKTNIHFVDYLLCFNNSFTQWLSRPQTQFVLKAYSFVHLLANIILYRIIIWFRWNNSNQLTRSEYFVNIYSLVFWISSTV